MTPLLLPYVVWPLVAAAFVALAWHPYRARRWLLVALAAIGLALGHGYVLYRVTCTRALSCDVGEPAGYLWILWPHYALQAAIGYGAAILFVDYAQRSVAEPRLSARALAFGALAAVGATHIAGGLLSIVWPWPS